MFRDVLVLEKGLFFCVSLGKSKDRKKKISPDILRSIFQVLTFLVPCGRQEDTEIQVHYPCLPLAHLFCFPSKVRFSISSNSSPCVYSLRVLMPTMDWGRQEDRTRSEGAGVRGGWPNLWLGTGNPGVQRTKRWMWIQRQELSAYSGVKDPVEEGMGRGQSSSGSFGCQYPELQIR